MLNARVQSTTIHNWQHFGWLHLYGIFRRAFAYRLIVDLLLNKTFQTFEWKFKEFLKRKRIIYDTRNQSESCWSKPHISKRGSFKSQFVMNEIPFKVQTNPICLLISQSYTLFNTSNYMVECSNHSVYRNWFNDKINEKESKNREKKNTQTTDSKWKKKKIKSQKICVTENESSESKSNFKAEMQTIVALVCLKR